jgi:enoyl-CoA hydratase/carnithine racemase
LGDFETIRYEVDDGLARITLARPDKRNAVNHVMFTELGDAAEKAAADPGVRAVLVAGEGPSFCAGIDLALLSELGSLAAQASEEEGDFRSFVRAAQRPFRSLARMPKPVVAAVQGHAVGAGLQLALACDLRVGSVDAMLGMLEPRYGLIPDLGGLHRLARLVGPSRAKELVWSTRIVGAQEALGIGLIDRIVEPDVLMTEAETLARQVSQHSTTVVALIKELIEGASETPLDDEFELEARAQSRAVRAEGGPD